MSLHNQYIKVKTDQRETLNFFLRAKTPFIAIGILSVSLHLVISLFTPYVAYDTYPTLIPILIYCFLAALAGGTVLLLFNAIKRFENSSGKNSKFIIGWILGIGLLLRLMMFTTTPVLEDDWIRYLWEGALGNEGISPYTYSPFYGFDIEDFNQDYETIIGTAIPDTREIERIRTLSEQNNDYAYEVAYPYLSTIYPQGGQLSFQLAAKIKPFSLNAWRLILLIADSLGIILLFQLLKLWNKSPYWTSLYWWNPLVILEGFNSAHMDILIIAPLLASIYFTFKNKPGLTGAMLGLGVSVKLWPLLLVPLFIRPIIGDYTTFTTLKNNVRIWFPSVSRFLFALFVVSVIGCYSLFAQAYTSHSGLSAYSEEWVKNSFLFTWLLTSVETVSVHANWIARISTALILSVITLFMAVRNKSTIHLPASILWITAALFFLAPAGFPWYSFWFLPLVALVPTKGLVVLAITLPIYYLRFPLFVMGYDWIFNFILAPIEFGIPLGFIIWDQLSKQGLKTS